MKIPIARLARLEFAVILVRQSSLLDCSGFDATLTPKQSGSGPKAFHISV